MSRVRSLGLHEPSALEYLVGEGILTKDPSPKDYHWQSYAVYDQEDDCWVEEEILRTKSCVVWSRGGVIKRVFGVDIEDEDVIEAFVTSFARHAILESANAVNDHGIDQHIGGKKQKTKSNNTASNVARPGPTLHRALVVVLHSQVHIYFLSGGTHVVPLSFEVESALPAPSGFVLQRKLPSGPSVPTVPPNSFTSSQATPRLSSGFTISQGRGSRPSLTLSTSGPETGALASEPADVPRLFYLIDPQAEIGVVAGSKSQKSLSTRRGQKLHAIDPNENLIYLSTKDELGDAEYGNDALYLAVTHNTKANTYTAWRVEVLEDSDATGSSRKRRRLDSTAIARRRSSNVFGLNTGATTPVGRAPVAVRESFGGLTTSQLENQNKAELQESQTTDLETLASQLGPDFGEVGVQTRAARRVSSMLARTDLATNQDRSTFNDIASGHPGRSSIGRSLRRGDSIGGFSDRTSFGPRRKSSIRGTNSFLSEETSFLDASVDQLLQGLNDSGEFRGFDTMGLYGPTSTMPKEMILTKLDSFSGTKNLHRQEYQGAERHHVFTMISPRTSTSINQDTIDDILSVCVMRKDAKEIIVLNIKASRSRGYGGDDDFTMMSARGRLSLHDMSVRRGSSISDACKIEDGMLSRMLLLSETREGDSILSLEAPWSSSIRLDLPKKFKVNNPFDISPDVPTTRRKDGGLKRVISDPIVSFQRLANVMCKGNLDLVDKEGKHHHIEIKLQPSDPRVQKVLEFATYALKDHAGDGLILAWWEVLRWLQFKDLEYDEEWTAMVVTLFCMAVPFIAGKHPRRPIEHRRKKADIQQPAYAGQFDDPWAALLESESKVPSTANPWATSTSWAWVENSVSKGHLVSPAVAVASPETDQFRSHSFIIQCAALARDFLQTPAGETAHGPEGFLPTAISKPRELRQTSLAAMLVGIHLLVEEDKLDVRKSSTSSKSMKTMIPVLAQIGNWLGWTSWSWKEDAYYATEIEDMDKWVFEDTQITLIEVPTELFPPPSVFAQFENWLQGSSSSPFLSLADVVGQSVTSLLLRQKSSTLTPRLWLLDYLQRHFEHGKTAADRVLTLAKAKVNQEILESLPEGIGALMHEYITRTQPDPPTNWVEDALKLIDRDDLQMSQTNHEPSAAMVKASMLPHHEAIRDYHTVGNMTLETEPYHVFDSSAEADRQFVTRLIYHEDRRFQDAAKLVNQLRPPVAECISEPDWSEADLLEAQKDLVQLVTLRTLAVSSGRGMMNFNSRIPLLTDKVPIQAFTLQCHMKPMNVTFSADRAAFTEEKVCWAFFHNGVSTGLAISKGAKGIDTSWILYNKPGDLTNRHAGFLLGLGLNGHLKALAKWVAFKYLTPKHTMVSIGLLLGLSASYLGTMDTLITRLLSVHVTRMLPPGAAELNLSPLTQTAGIMGIGLLYAGSQHRRMSEVMISEIENTDVEESPQNVLRDEGYRLASGFALGFINLGKGKDLRGLHDMNIVDRLLALAIGTKNVNLVHVLDRATAGATVAIALMFLKTDNATIAHKIDVPETIQQFDYVRPDIFLLRTLARHLIMWSEMEASENWISKSLPKVYRDRATLTTVHRLKSEDMPFFNILAGLCLALGLRYAGSGLPHVRDMLVHYLDQFIRLTRLSAPNYDTRLTRNSVRNCQDVVALAVSSVMAGTGDLNVFRRLRSLHGRIDADTPYGSHLAAHMAIGALFLAGGTHTFSTSNLAIASLLCAFYPIFPTFVLDNKAHLQAFRHFWVLAAEPRCLIPRDMSTHRPINVPIAITMNTGQTGKKTAPCLLPPFSTIKSIRTLSPEHWTVTLDFASSDTLPLSFASQQSIFLRRRSPYDAASSASSSTFVSSLQAHADADSVPSISATGSTAAVTTARAMQHASSFSGGLKNGTSFEWLFSLDAFKDLDVAERSLVLPPISSGSVLGASRMGLLRGTVVDTRLSLEKGILPTSLHAGHGHHDETKETVNISNVKKDRLWQLRLLFAWVERLDREVPVESSQQSTDQSSANQEHGSDLMWLRRQVIEGLRWRIWKLGNGVDDDDQDEN